jgi:hypothetical protein
MGMVCSNCEKVTQIKKNSMVLPYCKEMKKYISFDNECELVPKVFKDFLGDYREQQRRRLEGEL